ncbi:hypothetical protein [Streptacidiphilus carbonis]|jgi:hypothetical protein|uniref:hypothetical protein n=1 Tax=Streptacidiphilus carbonis TaxID=105422 RepID=UPI0005A7BF0D|nr:hypothetical protein [Streptacidiphilus carbonis]
MKLMKALRVGLTAAMLATGVGVLSAAPAHASSLVCVPLNGAWSDPCTHQTTIHFDNSTYYPGKAWWGPYDVLRLQSDGNLVLYCWNNGVQGKAVWASNTSQWNLASVHLTFWNDGNAAIYQTWFMSLTGVPGGGVAWDSETWGGSNSIGVVQADGNFVIWSGGKALWASNTYHACNNGDQFYWTGYR